MGEVRIRMPERVNHQSESGNLSPESAPDLRRPIPGENFLYGFKGARSAPDSAASWC